jgi:uncharacterized protein
MELAYGIITGIIFGFLLQKGQVLRYDKQLGALRLIDFTIIKFMFSAIIVAMIGIYLLKGIGFVSLSVKGTSLGANILGGIVFGIGWAILGYCPGTAAGAVGEGRWDAAFGLLGMLVGAAVYAEAYPAFKESVLNWGALGKITLPGLFGVNEWIVVIAVSAVFMWLFFFFERHDL